MSQEKGKLDRWEEIVGTLLGVQDDGNFIKIAIKVSHSKTIRLEYPIDSKEGKVIASKLGEMKDTGKVGVLRTDIPDKPIVVRVRDDDSQNYSGGG